MENTELSMICRFVKLLVNEVKFLAVKTGWLVKCAKSNSNIRRLICKCKHAWDTVFVFDEIDDMLDSWESLFNSVLDENCPWREKRVKRAAQAPWMTSSVLKQLHLRDNCLKTARRSNNADDWSNYRAARNKAVAMIRSAKRKFFCNAFEENKGNSRGIWKTIRTLTGSGKNRRDINSINIGEAVIDDKKLMAQHFNAHFSSIADRLRSTLPQVPSDPSKLQDFVRSRKRPDTSYVIPSITSAQVLTLLQKLSPCYSTCCCEID